VWKINNNKSFQEIFQESFIGLKSKRKITRKDLPSPRQKERERREREGVRVSEIER
jgi:hypothetical protein